LEATVLRTATSGTKERGIQQPTFDCDTHSAFDAALRVVANRVSEVGRQYNRSITIVNKI
jgi:hypothetical protein